MRVTTILILAALCTACAWQQPPPAAGDAPRPAPQGSTELRQRILTETLGQLGRPYRYGGGDGNGFDCSGLVRHVYADAGIDLPRTAAQQMRAGKRIRAGAAQPGDLKFYRIDGGHHVVIYIGDGRGVHAPAPGRTVSIAQVDNDWWQRRLRRTVRLLPD